MTSPSGREFWTDGGHGRCADVSARTVIAIKLDQRNPRNYNGPPYSVAECIMDEFDLVICYPTKALRDEQFDDGNDGPAW